MKYSSQYWYPIRLSTSGRPELIEDDKFVENDILIQNNIGLYQDDCKIIDYQDGKVYLTNKRLIFVDNKNSSNKNIAMNLTDIQDIMAIGGFLKTSPKIMLKMKKFRTKSRSAGKNNSGSGNGSINTSTSTGGHGRGNGGNRVTPVELNWICQICSFSNQIKSNYALESDADLPPCKSCGMKPSRELIETVLRTGTDSRSSISAVSQEGFQCPTCTFINDLSLKNCEMCGTRLTSSNLPPQLLSLGDSEFPNDDLVSPLNLELEDIGKRADEIDPTIIKFSFRKGGVKTFLSKLLVAKDQAEWEFLQQNSKINSDSIVTTTGSADIIPSTSTVNIVETGPKFGIHGLENTSELKNSRYASLLNNSLYDLENLISKANELIELSQAYQKILIKDNAASSFKKNKISDTANILLNSKNSINILNNIITKHEFINSSKESSLLSSLKKQSSNYDLYLEELARQLYEFLIDSDIISKNHGLITLFELFILYNRARGINLISPEELFNSAKLFEKLDFNYILFEIPLISKNLNDIINDHNLFTENNNNNDKYAKNKSNVVTSSNSDRICIISNRNFTSNSILTKILQFLQTQNQIGKPYKGLSILQIQKTKKLNLDINYIILNQILLESCINGDLCIDQQLQGGIYYANEITKFNWDDYMNGNDIEISMDENEKDAGYEQVVDDKNWIDDYYRDLNAMNDIEEEEDEDDDEAQEGEITLSKSNASLSKFNFNYQLTDTNDNNNSGHEQNSDQFNESLKDLVGLKF